MFLVVQDRLRRLDQFGVRAERLACIGISVEAWKIAAGYLDANPVAGQEGVACYPEIDFITIDFAGCDEARIVPRRGEGILPLRVAGVPPAIRRRDAFGTTRPGLS